ncbi:MAG: hypothetical protein ACXVGK_03370 [Mycobacteriaceae bacterium]
MVQVTSALMGSTVNLGYVGGAVPGEAGQPGGGGGRISIDVEKVPTVVHELDDVIVQLYDMGKRGRRLAKVTPPGWDAFSAYAAQSISEMAVGGVGDHATAHTAYVDVVIATRDRLVHAFIEYKGADAAVAAGMSPSVSAL